MFKFIKYNIFLFSISAAILGMSSCEKEIAFVFNEGEGVLNTESLDVDYLNGGTRAYDADTEAELKQKFTVEIQKKDGTPVHSSLFSAMPKYLSLPVGQYQLKAYFGQDIPAAWENPYYCGTKDFEIESGEITSIGKVECPIKNMRVKVNFDAISSKLSDDAYVIVKAGAAPNASQSPSSRVDDEADGLKYVKGETRTGYFMFVDGSKTIVATFYGKVDGEKMDGTTWTYSNAAPGNDYTIKFTASKPENNDNGDITVGGGSDDQTGENPDEGIKIDATVTVENVDGEEIDVEELDHLYDSKVDDNNRPGPPAEGDEENDDESGNE